ncbi:MAG: A/G-specific adenine glycosylase [Thermoplasmata archaeon]
MATAVEEIGAFRDALLAWYEGNRRDLPWRHTRDPYAILVSEILLQQTRTAAAESYYRRFMDRFPTPHALAEAGPEEVLHAWEGLGYYGRARRLHAAAKEIVKVHGGLVPRRPDVLRTLPGVGPYTAGAVASIAYEQKAPAVDGNVTRVLARVYRIEEDVGLSSTKRLIRARATRLVPDRVPGTFNQAFMELGALVCLPRKPRCKACPIRPWCQARAARVETTLPRRGKVSAVPTLAAVFALLERHDKVLLVRRGEDELLGGLWALPGGELAGTESPGRGLRRLLRERHGVRARPGPEIGRHVHTFSHKRWDAVAIRCELEEDPILSAHQRWIRREELGDLPLVPFHRAFLEEHGSPSLEAFTVER